MGLIAKKSTRRLKGLANKCIGVEGYAFEDYLESFAMSRVGPSCLHCRIML
jgi:hypothetical protein